MTVFAIIAAGIVTVSGFTGLWSAPYVPPTDPDPVAVAAVAEIDVPDVTTTTPPATVPVAQDEPSTPEAPPCATATLAWVDEWTVTVPTVTGPDGHGFLAAGVGHFVNYTHDGGPRRSVAPAIGSTTLTLCP
jgi:hypothetical protein